MKKILDKLNVNKKGIMFLIGISIIGFLCGVIFIIIISKSDRLLVKNYMIDYIKSLDKNIDYFNIFKNSLLSNLSFIILIWLLGMSVIGIPINIFYYFIKSFIIGFSVSSFILAYKIKGIIYSLIYVIPHNLVNVLMFSILVYYSFNFSITLIYSIVKKKSLNFKNLINNYLSILFITIIVIFITSLYETFVVTTIINKLLLIIK